MNGQCKFKVGKYNCGSFAFNLYKENIEQGDYCDRHYWQDRAVKAAEHEREACATFVDHILKEGGGTYGDAIRARGTT